MTGEAGMALTGMALAAGLGTRMRPLTETRPKPLIRVAGRTLLDRMLDRLAECGADRVVVNTHYLADQIEAHLEMRTGAPDVVVSDERAQLLETGGGLVKALPLLGSGPAIVANTDAVFVAPPGALTGLLAGFDPAREDARLILVAKDRAHGMTGTGDFDVTPEGLLVRAAPGQTAPYYYTGMQILNLSVLAGQPVEPFSIWRAWTPALAAGRLTGRVFDGEWLHVGDPEGLAAAEACLARPPRAAGAA